MPIVKTRSRLPHDLRLRYAALAVQAVAAVLPPVVSILLAQQAPSNAPHPCVVCPPQCQPGDTWLARPDRGPMMI